VVGALTRGSSGMLDRCDRQENDGAQAGSHDHEVEWAEVLKEAPQIHISDRGEQHEQARGGISGGLTVPLPRIETLQLGGARG
jgi:hypothetical protein